MIKVNLLKTKAKLPEAKKLGNGKMAAPKAEFKTEDLKTFGKFVGVLVLPALLFGYERYNLGELDKKVRIVEMKSNSMQQEINAKKQQVKIAEVHEKKVKKLEDRVAAIKEVSKSRLKKVKVLDSLQDLVPERVWFSKVDYKGNQLTLNGFAISDDDLNQLLAGLQAKPYFSSVILKKSKDATQNKTTVKDFEVVSTVGEID